MTMVDSDDLHSIANEVIERMSEAITRLALCSWQVKRGYSDISFI
jgi:hypothetical protein